MSEKTGCLITQCSAITENGQRGMKKTMKWIKQVSDKTGITVPYNLRTHKIQTFIVHFYVF